MLWANTVCLRRESIGATSSTPSQPVSPPSSPPQSLDGTYTSPSRPTSSGFSHGRLSVKLGGWAGT